MTCKDCKKFEADWGYSKCKLGFWRVGHDSLNPLALNGWAPLKVLMRVAAKNCSSFEAKGESL